MKPGNRFLQRSVVSVFDQALLSGLNLLVGVMLIRFASKEAYGFYTLLFAASVLSTTLIEALVGAALTTLASRMTDLELRKAFVSRAVRLQFGVACLVAIVLGIAAWFGVRSFGIDEDPVYVSTCFVGFICALNAREFCRTALFIESRAIDVAIVDGIYVILTLALSAACVMLLKHVTIVEVMCILAIANALAALIHGVKFWVGSHRFRWLDYQLDIEKLWALGQWAFIGAIVGWVGNNIYLYLAGIHLGIEASAELNASRLVMIPVALLGVAWSRVARPAVGKFIADKEWKELDRFGVKSVMSLGAITLGFTASMLLAMPWIEVGLLGEKYRTAVHLVPLWGLYFLINSVRTVGTTLLACYGAFKALFLQGMASLSILLPACWLLMPAWGVTGALSAMIIVELTELIVNQLFLLPRQRKLREQPANVGLAH